MKSLFGSMRSTKQHQQQTDQRTKPVSATEYTLHIGSLQHLIVLEILIAVGTTKIDIQSFGFS